METEKQVTQVSVEDLTNILKGHQFFRVRYFAKKHNDYIERIGVVDDKMRLWEDRSSGQTNLVVITEISGSQTTFDSDQAAEICAAIAQQICLLLGPGSSTGGDFAVEVQGLPMLLRVTDTMIALSTDAGAAQVQTFRYQDIRSWSVDPGRRLLSVWSSFSLTPLQMSRLL